MAIFCCTVPIPTSMTIFLWHCANVYLYTLVALCQSVPLYPSAKACPYTLVAMCQSIPLWLFSCGTVPIPAYTCMHLDSFKSIVGTAPPSLSPSPAPAVGREGRRLITDTL